MNMNQNFTPPPAPSSQVIESVFSLLAAISDPAAIKSRIQDLVAQTKAANDACAELAAERQRLIDENARAAGLRKQEEALAVKESDLEKGALAQQVAGSALADRAQKLDGREADLNTREKAIAQREAEHIRRIQAAKAALG